MFYDAIISSSIISIEKNALGCSVSNIFSSLSYLVAVELWQ